jgi:hypothetical protein
MREELSRSADTVGAMQLSPELQEELNHAAMRVCGAGGRPRGSLFGGRKAIWRWKTSWWGAATN